MYKQTNQKGVVHLLLLLAVAFVAVVGIGYFAYQNGQLRKLSPSEKTKTSKTVSDTSDWKTFTSSSGLMTFKYPSNWYWEPYLETEEAQSIDFFIEGATADHSSGDHHGNEIFNVNIQKDNRTLEAIKNYYYKDATSLTIAGKSAIKTPNNKYIVKPFPTYLVNISTGKLDSQEMAKQILSTFEFTNQ
jgi:hypothetical protein